MNATQRRTALVTGAASGLGHEIARALEPHYDVIEWDLATGQDVTTAPLLGDDELPETLDVLVNCAGVNIINWAADVTVEQWDRVMDVNARAMFFLTQQLLPQLRASRGTVLNIVSNASHMPMRCSAAYNASKGAAAILTRQLARELAADGITVFAVSPNKLRGTGMSASIDRQVMRTRGWTEAEAQAYQLAGMLTGQETEAADVAEFVAFLLSDKRRHRALSGCDLPYGA